VDARVQWIVDAVVALVSAVGALRGRDAWRRARAKREGVLRCPICQHRCTHCMRTASMNSLDPPNVEFVDDSDTRDTPKHFRGRQ